MHATGQATYRASDPVLVDVTITNVSSHNVKLLSWMLPGGGLEQELFVVTHGGQRVGFVGARYKRSAAEDGDFVQLDAGASLTRQVDLAPFYDLSQTGEYELQLVVGDDELRPGEGAAATVASNPVRVWIEGRAAAAREPAEPVILAGSLAFSRCTTTQQSAVIQAVANASSYSAGALSFLSRIPTASERYTTWFGRFSPAGWDTAKNHFTAIANAFDTKPITVDCGCQDRNSYAYVYANQPYTIYVCAVFWQAPLTGTDSKAGTLIHEMSHFTVVSNTHDHAYGKPACKSLAISDPSKALDNADSHEYFAENTPALTYTPVPTETFLTLDGYQDGAPGTASVSGNVFRAGGSAPAIGTVNVNFLKLVDGTWMLMSTAQQTLVNGHYDVLNWGVGVGQWRVRAVFPAQGDYAESESSYHEFEIQRVATNTFITLGEVLNGQPGYASVSGNVLRTNGDPVSGTVNVNFQKLVDGAWTTMSTAQPTLSNGSYDVAYWRVGVGQWRVRAVFSEQGDYAASESNYHQFEVKSGYRLVNRHSDKCMSLSGNNGANGTAILQWDCSGSPSPGDGQVFTLYPLGGGDFNLVINSTGKCVDVTGVSPDDGAYLQQWDCLGPGQRNQVWRVIPIAGQPPYVAFQVQHSGKCADVLGGGTGNGTRIGQWGCWWGGNQQWYFQAIN